MREDEQYIAKKSADEISYLIDDLIEHVSDNAAARTLIDGNQLPFSDYEKGLRALAAESRLSRRHLARALVGLRSSASALGRPRSRCVVSSDKSGTGYCFLVYPCPPGRDHDRHRLSRSALLADYCRVMKVQFPELQHIVGYAAEPLDGEQHSEDLAYLDATNWSEEDAHAARTVQRETGILTSPEVTHVHDQEYPTSPDGK